jgi:RNA polymerase-binding transcription factor DksA
MNATTYRATLTRAHQSTFEARLDEQRQLRLDLIAQYSQGQPCHRPRSVADREVIDAIVQGAESALTDINAALARMRDGTFGRCVQCACALPTEWLEVLPQLARCVACDRAAR